MVNYVNLSISVTSLAHTRALRLSGASLGKISHLLEL